MIYIIETQQKHMFFRQDFSRQDIGTCFWKLNDQVYIHIHIDKYTYVYMYMFLPGTCLSSILVVEPFKAKSFPMKTRVFWVQGVYI